MTNTLHRYGNKGSFTDDWIVFTRTARGINDKDCEPKIRVILRAAAKYDPVNLRASEVGAMYRPEKNLNPFKIYFFGRRHVLRSEEIIKEAAQPRGVTAVFNKRDNMEAFIKELKELDLGISVNISALTDETRESCLNVGIVPHSVEYSLGFRGQVDRLPSRKALELSTMCGHGMVSGNFANKMIEHVKEGRQKPEMAGQYLAKLCVCGIYNVARAQRLLEQAQQSN